MSFHFLAEIFIDALADAEERGNPSQRRATRSHHVEQLQSHARERPRLNVQYSATGASDCFPIRRVQSRGFGVVRAAFVV